MLNIASRRIILGYSLLLKCCMLCFQLEKEALVKGVPVGQAIDIEIPPPRPKRKPSNPYPRKTGTVSSPNTRIRAKDGKQASSSSSQTAKQTLDLEKEPFPEKCAGDDGKSNAKETCGDGPDGKSSEAVKLFQEGMSTLSASANENSATTMNAASQSCNFKEFVPLKKQLVNHGNTDSHAADGSNTSHKPDKRDNAETDQNNTEHGIHAAKNFPRHALVHILDGSSGACSQAPSSDVSYQESAFHQMGIPSHPPLFSNPAVSVAVESQNSTSRSPNHAMFPSFHPPFTHFPNGLEDYSSFLQMSSAFSSLLMSALLQNPAAHAAASFAASFWPSPNMESSANSPAGNNVGFPHQPMNPAPNMVAIAAATVAAATAWWAAHGFLPLSAPLHNGFTCTPTGATAPFTNVAETQVTNEERVENNLKNHVSSQVQQPDQELSEALQPEQSASKSSATSLSDSGNSSGAKADANVAVKNTEKRAPRISDQEESSKGKSKKLVDRSSCGSNTPSGSDVETNALEKNEEGKDEPKEPDVSHTTSEPSNRRNRIAGNTNESWKEVSEEGRLAFQALFSRERLPQSFSPPQDIGPDEQEMKNGAQENRQRAEGSNEEASQLDLNNTTWETCSCDQGVEKDRLSEDNEQEGLLTIGLTQGELKARRTGFKPYKRCSVEARESRVMNSASQDQEKCPKRLRLEGVAST